uniref:Galectin n=1 Tax=Globodera pallida TaxID=36090 RepID=A0A183C926_GLOPA
MSLNVVPSSLPSGEENNYVFTNKKITTTPSALPIPYRGVLDVRFEPGQTLMVKGTAGQEARRFNISLHNKSADFSGNDVPLHISVRFDQAKIALNSMVNNAWGKEQRKPCPLKPGQPFDVRIRAHDKEFQIIIDGKEFKKYTYQLPLQSITHLSIDGDLTIQQIHWGGKIYPVPYETGLPRGFPVGKRLKVFGSPTMKKGGRFEVNLLRRNGDIALHVNPRFDQKAVVRNALEAGEWGNEEREGKMPLEKGHCFDLAILNEANHFGIFINAQHYANFVHRSKPDDIFGLLIRGDVELIGLEME